MPMNEFELQFGSYNSFQLTWKIARKKQKVNPITLVTTAHRQKANATML